jgi:hypothetical protein
VLLAVLGGMVTLAALMIGFGAVLLTRGGRQPAYADGGGYWSDPWDDDLGYGGPSAPRHAPEPDATMGGAPRDRATPSPGPGEDPLA